MYITINTASNFMDEFTRMGRDDQFSYDALEALFEHYNEFENYELDVIGICCDWAEYESEEEALESYDAETLEELQDNYYVIELDNGHVLIQD